MPPETIIRSRQNPIYKQIRSLLRRDRRIQERAFLVEGPRFIADAITTGALPTLIAQSETRATTGELFEVSGVPTRVFDDDLFASIADTVTSQGVLAIFPFPEPEPSSHDIPFVVISDGIQDPGNLGTLIRSAAGAGATEFVTLPGTADPWAPKTVRAAAAAHFILPITSTSVDALFEVIPTGCLVLAADANATQSYDALDLTGPIAVVIGSEGRGLSAGILAHAPRLVSIPLAAGLESLNAAVAGSIILFEASRQRRNASNSAKNSVSG
jgi:TrmH family RNA methyltransferase